MRNTAVLGTSTRVNALLALADLGGGGAVADSGFVFVRPIDGVTDDWPTLMGTIAVANAYKKIIVMLPGLHGERWQCLSSVRTPNGTTIWGTPGTIIEQGINGSNTADCAFNSNVTGAATFTLQAAASAGAQSVHLTTAPAVGAIIGIFSPNGLLGMVTHVTNVAGAAGNFTVTLGRPLMFDEPINGIVQTFATIPQDIRIVGNGMQMIGKAGAIKVGSAFANYVAGREIFMSDIIMDAAGFTNAQISGGAIYDVGSYRCFHVNMIVKNVTGAGTDFAGCDACEAISVTVQNCSTSGYRVEDTFNSNWIECQAFDCGVVGMDLTGATVNGSFQNTLTGCIFEGNLTGVTVDNGTITPNTGSNRNMFIGCTFNGNVSDGIDIATGFETSLTGCQACFNGSIGVSNTAPNTIITNLIASGNVTSDLVTTAELNVSGFTSLKAAGASTAPQVDVKTGGILNMSNFNVRNLVSTGQIFEVRTSATGRFTNGQVHCDTTGTTQIAFQLDGAASKLYISNTRLTEATVQCIGINGNTGSTTRFGSGVDIMSGGIFGVNITTPGAFSNMSFKAGTVAGGPTPFTENGATPVAVSYPDIRATDIVILQPESGTSTNTLGSTVITPGTGFTYTGSGAGSNRVIEWRVEG